jgi:hypothetical protein
VSNHPFKFPAKFGMFAWAYSLQSLDSTELFFL